MTRVSYERIDCEIRNLVRVINTFPGIRTFTSCAGHLPIPPVRAMVAIESEIGFTADSQDALNRLFSALPFWGWQGTASPDAVEWRQVWVTVTPATHYSGALQRRLGRRIVYKLRISGYPHYWQRLAVEEVEQALILAAGLPPGNSHQR